MEVSIKTSKRRTCSQDVLCYIAMITMFFDHFATIVIENGILQSYDLKQDFLDIMANHHARSYFFVYSVLKILGRIAFPMYGYFLAIGAKKTHNYRNYMVRILCFAILSEIPFDLAIYGKFIITKHQNVLFTFFLSLISIYIIQQVMTVIKQKYIRIGCSFSIAVLFFCLGELLNVDYGGYGVLFVLILYYVEDKRWKYLLSYLSLVLFLFNEIFSGIAYLFIWLDNGSRKRKHKYVYYAFYPAHFMFLYLLSKFVF